MSNAVPDGWSMQRQGDICEFSNGRAYKLSEWEKEGTPVIRLQNLTGSGKEFYYSNLELPERQYCNSGDLLYMWSATFGPHIWKGQKAIYHYHIWKVTPDEVNLTKDYSYQLLGYKTQEWLNKSNGMGILHVTKGGMEDLSLTLPPLPEQQKIAAILSSVDDVIEKTQAQIDKLKDLKTGMMQELLSPIEGSEQSKSACGGNKSGHTEFKDSPVGRIPVGWDVCTLGDITTESAFGPRFSSDYYSESGNIGCIRTTDMDENWDIDYSTVPLAGLNFEEFESHILSDGDLLVTRSGTCGVVDVFQEQPVPMVAAAFLIRFRLSDTVNPWFIRLSMMSSSIQENIQMLASGGVQKNLSGTNLKTLRLPLPSKEEQNRIVGVVSSINERIALATKKRNQLEATKKALMQDLLTGIVRVTVPSHPCDHGISASMHVKLD